MKKILYILSCVLFATVAHGQVEMKEVKDEAKEMKSKAPAQLEATDYRYVFKGDVDKTLAHPDCDDAQGGEREDCTVELILADIKKSLNYDASMSKPLEKDLDVEIGFSVNEFGNVKNIKVQYSGDVRLTQAIIQALYSIPRMSAAEKEGVAVPSSCQITYPYAAIFPQ